MLRTSESNDAQAAVEICGIGEGLKALYVRMNDREEERADGEGACTIHVCDEAYMELADGECPDMAEVAEDMEGWFEFASDWTPDNPKSLRQLQADVEYIAIMTGIEL